MDKEVRNRHKILVEGGFKGEKHLTDLVAEGRLAEITHHLPIPLNALVVLIPSSFIATLYQLVESS